MKIIAGKMSAADWFVDAFCYSLTTYHDRALM